MELQRYHVRVIKEKYENETHDATIKNFPIEKLVFLLTITKTVSNS